MLLEITMTTMMMNMWNDEAVIPGTWPSSTSIIESLGLNLCTRAGLRTIIEWDLSVKGGLSAMVRLRLPVQFVLFCKLCVDTFKSPYKLHRLP